MSGKISNNDYLVLSNFLSREFGLFFDAAKVTYLENRVLPLLAAMNCRDMNHFVADIQNNMSRRSQLLDALTTNETWFFRHPRHFDILRDEVLPALIRGKTKTGKREISIWSAGCSIGAETFSIAITVHEMIKELTDWKITIIGSDISAKAINRALNGNYTISELKLLSNMLLSRYFFPTSPDIYQIKPEIQAMVNFESMNLLDTWPDRTFDVIFCRNTMIYFKEETKEKLTERFYGILTPDGTFFTSATETLHWQGENKFERIFLHGEYIYRKILGGNSYILYRFKTPSDLLRALNILVKSNLEYQLMSIPQSTPASPKKAIYIPKDLENDVDRMFGDVALQSMSREEFTK